MKAWRGFSIIEAFIYIIIIVIVATLAAEMIATTATAFGKARMQRLINEQGIALMERIIREVRLAHSVDTGNSTFDVHPGKLTLNTILSPTDETATTRRFSLSGSTLMLQEGISSASQFTSGVEITNLVFRNLQSSASAYYVRGSWASCSDGAQGTSPTTAFCTIAPAASLAVAGTVIFVGPGTYSESVTPAQGGESGNPITFFADANGTYTTDNPGTVIVQGTSLPAFNLSERSFITIIGFIIQNSSDGIYFDNTSTVNSTNIIIENNTFTNITGQAAINNDDGTNQTMNANHIIRRNLIYNSPAHAMMFDRAGNILIEQNVVYSNGTDNIAIIASTGTVKNNLIYKSGGREGLDLRGTTGWPMNLVITNNTLYQNRAGIQITDIKSGDTYLIQDNVIKNNSGGSQDGGIYVENTAGMTCAISYNIFHGNGPDIDDAGNRCSKSNNLFTDPFLVDPDGADNVLGGTNGADDQFQLSHIAAGQGNDSPAVNAGSQNATVSGLDTWTTRTDSVGDVGIVDMGYHYPTAPYTNPSFSVGTGPSASQAVRVELTIEAGSGRQRASQNFYDTAILRRSY